MPRRAGRQLRTIPRAVRAGRARAKVLPPPARVDGARLRDLLREVAADVDLVEVPVDRKPWTTSRVRVATGEQVSWFAWGRCLLIKPLAVGVDTGLALLCRIGDGLPTNSERATMTLTADRDGAVEFGGRMPAWTREDGTLGLDRVPYRLMSGGLGAVVVRWAPGTDVRAALDSLAARDPSGLCAAEVRRLDSPPQLPPGWHCHPWVPRTEVFSAGAEGVAVNSVDGGGIIRHPAAAPLTPDLRLRWSWRIDELPSRMPEDTAISHDYLSVAVEFDNGLDLTWQWSHSLPLGLAYPCPLDYWRKYETHIVARTGSADLGRWISEERPVLADYRAAIRGPAPANVVRVWLIAVSFIQGRTGRGEFRDIELVDGDRVARVT